MKYHLEDKNITVMKGETVPPEVILELAAEGDSWAKRELLKNGYADYTPADEGMWMEPRTNE